MPEAVHELGGLRVMAVGTDGPPIVSRRDVTDLIGDAAGADVDMVAVPTARQGAAFFDLRTRIAGEMLQMCVTYGLRVAFVGPIPPEVADSEALRAFMLESNRGRSVWFVSDMAELARRAPVAA